MTSSFDSQAALEASEDLEYAATRNLASEEGAFARGIDTHRSFRHWLMGEIERRTKPADIIASAHNLLGNMVAELTANIATNEGTDFDIELQRVAMEIFRIAHICGHESATVTERVVKR